MKKALALCLGLVGLMIGFSEPASAQATRTWVSGVGDDANPCSRTAPCKTFAGAISKTATGGEINCLDPGGFGGVTITKSLTIDCRFTEGGILSAGAGVNGVIINAPATSHVYLRGLDFHGAGSAQNGIRFLAGASLTVEDTVIRAYNASNGLGISFQPSGSSRLVLNRVTVTNNGSPGTGGGILIQPTGAAGTARVYMQNVDLLVNENNALRVDTTGNTAGTGIVVDIENSSFMGSTNGINVITPVGSQSAIVNVNGSAIFNNPGNALAVNGASAVIRVSASTITTNGAATSILGGGAISSYGDNRTVGNSVAPAFTPPTLTRN